MLKLVLLGFSICFISCLTLETQYNDQVTNDMRIDESKREMVKKRIFNTKHMRKPVGSGKMICEPTPLETLNRILGPAFNARYMAVEKPQDESMISEKVTDVDPSEQRDARMIRHKNIAKVEDFAVDPKFSRILIDGFLSRGKRNVDIVADEEYKKMIDSRLSDRLKKEKDYEQQNDEYETKTTEIPWKCTSQIEWIDLGKDYFPRYLRSAKCISEKCWYESFRCTGRAFTVKVLRRRRGNCISYVNNETVISYEDWVFEERALNFCCECTKRIY